MTYHREKWLQADHSCAIRHNGFIAGAEKDTHAGFKHHIELCVCMYVYIYKLICVARYIYIHVCMIMYVCMCSDMNTHTHRDTRPRMRTCPVSCEEDREIDL